MINASLLIAVIKFNIQERQQRHNIVIILNVLQEIPYYRNRIINRWKQSVTQATDA